MNLCQYCALNNRVTVADMVDHIVPREVDESMELEADNLVASCNSCHRLKQDWEQRHYGTGQRNKLDSNAILIKDIHFIKEVFKDAKN
nr:HNH endonuclease signature motif containing protein [Weissella oryzae]